MRPTTTNIFKINILFIAFIFISQNTFSQIGIIPITDFVIEVDLSIDGIHTNANGPYPPGQFALGGAQSISYVNVYTQDGTTLLHSYNIGATNGQRIDDSDWSATTHDTVKIAYSNDITTITYAQNINQTIPGANSKITSIAQWGTAVYGGISFQAATHPNFTLDATDVPTFAPGANLNRLFRFCTHFTDSSGTIGNWNTTNVVTMGNAFESAEAFDANLTNWDVSNVTNMRQMFDNAEAFNNGDNSGLNPSQLSLPAADQVAGINGWNVNAITGQGYEFMFRSTETFNRDIGDWNIGSGATSLSNMFQSALVFNQDLSAWNVGNITNMSATFANTPQFTNGDNSRLNPSQLSLPVADQVTGINGWNVNAVVHFSNTFQNAVVFNRDITAWKINNTLNAGVTMSAMFSGAVIFDQDLSLWDVSEVINMNSMFNGAHAFKNGNNSLQNTGAHNTTGRTGLNSWDVSKVTSFSSMFRIGTPPNGFVFNIDLKDWNTGSATQMASMFRNQQIFNQDLSNWDVADVISFREMFLGALLFNNGNNNYMGKSINDWDVSNATNLGRMFHTARVFNRDIGNWTINNTFNPSDPTDPIDVRMDGMFEEADAFNQDLSLWDVSHVSTMRLMFSGANVFNNSDNNRTANGIGGWNTGNVSSIGFEHMFRFTNAFNRNINDWNVENATSFHQMFRNANVFNQNLDNWNPINVTNFTLFLDNSALSQSTYDQFLMAWANKDLIDGVIIGVLNLEYCAGGPARDRLIDEQNITFNGDDRACSPGDYTNNVIFWHSADAISGIMNANPVTEWVDLSSAENNFTEPTNAPILDTINVINFNPVLGFNGISNVLSVDPFPVTNTFDEIGNTTFFIMYKQPVHANGNAFLSFNNAGSNDFYTHYAPDASGNITLSGEESVISSTQNVIPPATYTKTPDQFTASVSVTQGVNTPALLQFTRAVGVAANDTDPGGGDVRFYENGTQSIIPITNTDDGRFTRTTDIFLGAANTSSDFFAGDIAEVLAFQDVPNPNERNTVNTYFALKYSVQMDIDYLAAYDQNTVLWDYNGVNATYHNNVIGLGRDDVGAFNQKVSKSTNTGAILTIATTNDFINLNSHTKRSDLSRDSTYLVMGHNASLDTVWTSVGAPEDFQIIGRNWKIQITGNLEDSIYLQFDVDDADFDIPNGNQSSVYYVVVDSDNDGDFSNNTPTLLSNTSGSLWSGLVELSNGNLFTLSTPFTNSPGGELDFLNAWFKADAGALQRDSTVAINNTDSVVIWETQAGSTIHNVSVQSPVSHPAVIPIAPTYIENHLNFNPSVNFGGVGKNILINNNISFLGIDDYVIYAVTFQRNATRSIINAGRTTNTGTNKFNFSQNTNASGFASGIYGLNSPALGLNEHGIFRFVSEENDEAVGGARSSFYNEKAFNGNILNSLNTPDERGTQSANAFAIGGNPRSNTTSGDLNDAIAEVIIYTGNDITAFPNHNKVESYLAIKYGLTLDQDSGKNNYTASDGSTIWDTLTASMGFDNDIFGIGTDETSGLFQKISNSINHDGIVILSLNENLVVNNQDSLRTETLTDLNFLTIANNDSALNWEDNPSDRIFNCVCSYASGMKRIWEVTEVTTTGVADSLNDVYVGIPSNRLGRDSLPSVGNDPLTVLEPNRGFSTLYLLVDSNSGSDFTNNTFRYYEMELDSDGIYRTTEKVDLNDNNRFTFSFIRDPSRLRHGKDVLFDRRIRTYRAGK